MDEIPEVIYLQLYDFAEERLFGDEMTWCADQINESDLKYFHESRVEELRNAIGALLLIIEDHGTREMLAHATDLANARSLIHAARWSGERDG